jgi:hypothetical protein
MAMATATAGATLRVTTAATVPKTVVRYLGQAGLDLQESLAAVPASRKKLLKAVLWHQLPIPSTVMRATTMTTGWL